MHQTIKGWLKKGKKKRKRIFVDTVSTNKNYAVDTLGAPCTKEHFALKVNFELKVHFVL